MPNAFLTILPSNNTLLRIPVELLVYIEADANYCVAHVAGLSNPDVRNIERQLGKVEEAIQEQFSGQSIPLARVGKSLIINLRYVYLVDITHQRLLLMDCYGQRHELRASKEALTDLCEFFKSRL